MVGGQAEGVHAIAAVRLRLRSTARRFKPGEEAAEVVDVAGRKPGEFAAQGGDAKSLIGLGNYRDLVILALLFGQRFAEVESDLAGAAFELIVASVRLAEQHKDGALVGGNLRDALVAGGE